MINLNDSDFALFGLPCRFDLDSTALSGAYLRLQHQTHPDRFSKASAHEKRLAMQWSTRINEAYRRLQNPVERAIYWCELNGQNPRKAQSNLPAQLLTQQMQWREQLEEIGSVHELKALMEIVLTEKKNCLRSIAICIDEQKDSEKTSGEVQALLFIEKFLFDLNRKLDQMEDAT